MRKSVKLAMGLGAVLLVALLSLGVLGMFWAVATPGFERTSGTVYDPLAQYAGVSAHNGEVAWVQTNPSMTWLGVIVRTGGLFFMFLLALIIALRFSRRPSSPPTDESALFQELARRAQDLSLRMEALETILLDRSDEFRETAGRS